jgi:hypothetical protein
VAARPIRAQIDELRNLVEDRFASVNRRILAGENAFVRVQDGKTVWERAVYSEEPTASDPRLIPSSGQGRAPRRRHPVAAR